MWFFILHELVPTYKDNYGKRNCRVFLYGVVLYCASFLILLNLFLYNAISQLLYDALYWIGIILILSDICVIAYEYKYFFGRNILNEVKELGDDKNQQDWIYDNQNHMYIKNNNNETNQNNDLTNRIDSKSEKPIKLTKSKKISKSNKKYEIEK